VDIKQKIAKCKVYNNILVAIVVIVFSFLIFFWKFFDSTQLLIGTQTTDLLSMHYPFHFYLYEKLNQEHMFPFWTERLHGGFPMYADLEKAYLSPINLLLTIIFGPINSIYATYLLFYLAGAIGLYLLMRKYKISLLEWVPAHFIYYFSFFHLLRLQLLNSVTVSFTLPLNLFFIKHYADTKQLRWLFAGNILNAINFEYGQLNYLFLSILAQCIYLFWLIGSRASTDIKTTVKSLSFFSFTLLALTIHSIIPASRLFMLGDRNSGSISYLEGSLSPATFLVAIYPYVFGEPTNYIGKEIDHNYYINEIYIFPGIVAFILAVLGLLKLKDKRLLGFILTILSIFTILSVIKYIPLLNSINIPPLSLFRFWVRSSIYFVLAISFLVSMGLHYVNEKTNIKRIWLLVIAIAFLSTLEIINGITYTTKLMITNFTHGGFSKDSSFYVWIMLFISSLILIILSKKNLQTIKLAFIGLVILETTYFGLKNISSSFAPRENYFKFTPVDTNLKNERIVNSNQKEFYGNTHLYYKSWSLFGYSGPFEAKNYGDYLRNTEFLSTRKTKIDINTSSPDERYVQLLKTLGVHRIYNDIFEYVDIPLSTDNIDLIKSTSTTSSYISKKEGQISYIINNPTPKDLVVQTTIKNYYGWEIKIDNNIQDYPKGTLFIEFKLSPGTHTVEMQFIPKDFIYGLAATILLVSLIPIIYKFTKTNIVHVV